MDWKIILIDIITVAVIVISALLGKKRGLIKTVSGILALILSFTLAGYLATATTPAISEKYVLPKVTISLEEQIDAIAGADAEDNTAIADALEQIGVPKDIIESTFTDAIANPLNSISSFISEKLTYAVLFVVYFIILMILISLLFRLLDLASRVPVLNFINKFLGLLAGVVWGYFLVKIVSSVFTNFDFYLTNEMVSQTFILKFIMNLSFAPLF